MTRTKPKKTQEQSFLKSILNSTQDSIISKNLEETITSWNPGSEILYGYSEKEILGKHSSILIPANLKSEEKEIFTRLKSGKFVDQLDTKRLRKDGSLIDVSIISSPIHDSLGNITGVAITSRKKKNELINAELPDMYAIENVSILNTIPANIALINTEGIIQTVNEQWVNFGLENSSKSNSKNIGDNYITISENATGDDELTGKKMATGIRAVLDGTVNEFTLEYPCHSPEQQRWFQVKVAPIKSDRINGAVVMHTNITERINTEKELRKMTRLYAFISAINQAITHLKNDEEIFNRVCSIAIELGKFKTAWIGKIDANNKKINIIEGFGILPEDMTRFSNVKYDKGGPQSYVLKNNTSYICNNIQDGLELKSWIPYATKAEVNSVMVLPIRKSGNIMYTLNLYAPETNFFNGSEIGLLEGVADDISFALDAFEKDRQKAIVESNLLAIFESTSEGFVLAEANGSLKTFNKNAAKYIFAITEQEVNEASSIYDFIPSSRHQRYKMVISKVLGGKSIQYDYHCRKTNEISKCFKFNLNPVYSINGRIEGVCITIADITEQSNSEKLIAENEAKYRSFFENSMDGILLTITDGSILAANPAACKMFKMTEEEICKAGRMGIVDVGDPRVIEAIKQRQKTGEVKAEVTFIRKDGSKFPGEITSSVFFTSGGENRTSMIIRDITERREAEIKLREREANMNAIFNNTSEGFILADTNGLIKFLNNKSKEIAAVNSGKEIKIGDNIFNHVQLSDRETNKLTIEKVLSGETFQYDYKYIFKNGDFRWYQYTNCPVFINGQIVGFSISTVDITERKNAENILKQTSIKLERAINDLNKIFNSSLDVICTINSKGEFVNISAASEQVWGYKPDELTGTKYMDLVYKDDSDLTEKESKKIESGIQVTDFENRYIHKNGKLVSMLWSANWDEKLQLMFCIAKDVTEKKRLEKALLNERNQFFNMFEKAPSAIGMLTGADHRFVMANPLYLLSTKKTDIIGKTVAEVFPEIKDQGFIEILDHVYRTGEPYVGTEILAQINVTGKDEMTDFYMNLIYQSYKNSEGEIEGVFFHKRCN
jgi:PAS domain S-box-containing protein